MTLRRRLIRTFDRPGGRTLLAAAITYLASKAAPGVRVYFHRGMWMHRSEDWVFVDSTKLNYDPRVFRTWAHEADLCLRYANDHWMHLYRGSPGDIVLDIGAGKGEDTIAFSQAVGPSGRVFAVEAHPATFRCLQLFQELNHLDNAVPIRIAITAHAGTVAIDSSADWYANTIGTPAAAGSLLVPGIPLDELIEQHKIRRIDFLKMNIEGAEAPALDGMKQTLAVAQTLCISCHDFRANLGHGEQFRTKAAVQAAVKAAGFRIASRDDDPRRYVADQVNATRL